MDVVEEAVEILELGEGVEDLAEVVFNTDDDEILELGVEITEVDVVLELDLLEVFGHEVPVQDVARDIKI